MEKKGASSHGSLLSLGGRIILEKLSCSVARFMFCFSFGIPKGFRKRLDFLELGYLGRRKRGYKTLMQFQPYLISKLNLNISAKTYERLEFYAYY